MDGSLLKAIPVVHLLLQTFDDYISNTQLELCDRPCASISVFTGYPFYGTSYDNTTARIKLYMKSTTKVKKTILDYTVLSMLAEIGGYTGLLLGISIVNVTHIIDKLRMRMT